MTACDIRKTPLEESSVDLAVFCLSLMAEQVDDFIKEANRILKPSAKLVIAEVTSRIENMAKFKRGLGAYGFTVTSEVWIQILIIFKNFSFRIFLFIFLTFFLFFCRKNLNLFQDNSNSHFVLLILKKFRDIEDGKRLPALKFKACQYKKR